MPEPVVAPEEDVPVGSVVLELPGVVPGVAGVLAPLGLEYVPEELELGLELGLEYVPEEPELGLDMLPEPELP